ncbi:POK11 protein, partial [Molothrus ater]|nr:POK11 protein [Molothrus ater]
GMEIRVDKIQYTKPWTYLGVQIWERTIVPQQLTINDDPKTLRDLHSLCGSINWVRPLLGITTEDLAPLFNLLSHRFEPSLPFQFIILGKAPRFHGLIFQWDSQLRDPLLILEWVFTSSQPTETLTTYQEIIAHLRKKARTRLRSLSGCEFECIYLPITLPDFEDLIQTNESLQFALHSYTGQISFRIPKHKLFNPDVTFHLIPKQIQSRKPLKALTLFTDGSGSSHKSVVTWRDLQTQNWESDTQIVEGSPQIAELAAVVRAFEKFKNEPFNLVTDSAYVAGIAMRAEHALLKEVSNPKLYQLLSKLIYLISHRNQPYHIMHVRSHTDLPGFVAEGNRKADALAMAAETANVPNIFAQAKLSHAFFHQNIPALMRMFKLSKDQAKAIVATCPNCQNYQIPSMGMGVDPRGLNSFQLWQTDVTHFAPFGRSKYVHVSVDTFSGAVFASSHAGENTMHTIKHFLLAFAALGVPKEIKTDNGPAYTSRKLKEFFNEWGIAHKTGIPVNPTGQSIVERTHQTLK